MQPIDPYEFLVPKRQISHQKYDDPYIRELEARAAASAQYIAELNDRIKLLEEQFRLAQSKRFAPSSEKLKDRVFDEAEQMADVDAANDDEDEALAPPDKGLPEPDKPAGRKPLPAELPRQRIEYDPTEDQKICPCCQGSMHRMGEEVCEQLHVEAKVSVLQHVRFKYACRHCERNADTHAGGDRADASATTAGQQREPGNAGDGDHR